MKANVSSSTKIRIKKPPEEKVVKIKKKNNDFESKEGLLEIVNGHLGDFYKDLEEKKRTGNIPEPYNFRMSTMSAVCELTYKLDTDLLYNYVSQNLTDKIIGMQYGKKEVGVLKKKKRKDNNEQHKLTKKHHTKVGRRTYHNES